MAVKGLGNDWLLLIYCLLEREKTSILIAHFLCINRPRIPWANLDNIEGKKSSQLLRRPQTAWWSNSHFIVFSHTRSTIQLCSQFNPFAQPIVPCDYCMFLLLSSSSLVFTCQTSSPLNDGHFWRRWEKYGWKTDREAFEKKMVGSKPIRCLMELNTILKWNHIKKGDDGGLFRRMIWNRCANKDVWRKKNETEKRWYTAINCGALFGVRLSDMCPTNEN